MYLKIDERRMWHKGYSSTFSKLLSQVCKARYGIAAPPCINLAKLLLQHPILCCWGPLLYTRAGIITNGVKKNIDVFHRTPLIYALRGWRYEASRLTTVFDDSTSWAGKLQIELFLRGRIVVATIWVGWVQILAEAFKENIQDTEP